ncbi:MAG TPA: DUF1127 domain-containing protein [Acetobacteraceae bacterium]|nr:DUF1127 domain-containing protein [Acetobacteraceae bacterium]
MSGHTLPHRLAARRGGVSAARRDGGWLAWLARCLEAVETRRALARMDDRMLKDIGLTRSEAQRESGRMPWDLSTPRR